MIRLEVRDCYTKLDLTPEEQELIEATGWEINRQTSEEATAHPPSIEYPTKWLGVSEMLAIMRVVGNSFFAELKTVIDLGGQVAGNLYWKTRVQSHRNEIIMCRMLIKDTAEKPK